MSCFILEIGLDLFLYMMHCRAAVCMKTFGGACFGFMKCVLNTVNRFRIICWVGCRKEVREATYLRWYASLCDWWNFFKTVV